MSPASPIRLLASLGRHGPWLLFGGVFLGLLFPGLAALCRPLLTPAVALLLFAMLLRINIDDLTGNLRRPWRILALTAWLLIACPLVTWLLLTPFDLPVALTTAIVLMAAAPPILATAAFALTLGLDAALAMAACLAATLLTPFSLPLLALGLLGLELAVGTAELMLRLSGVILAALLGAFLVRRLVGQARLERAADSLDGIVVLMLLLFAVAIMDGVTATLIDSPGKVALWVIAAFVANPALQALGALAFARMGLKQALTVGILSGNCNMGLVLAALPAGSDQDVALYFALAQLPMYMFPALLLPLYRRLLTNADSSA